jgi:hypothetical protein
MLLEIEKRIVWCRWSLKQLNIKNQGNLNFFTDGTWTLQFFLAEFSMVFRLQNFPLWSIVAHSLNNRFSKLNNVKFSDLSNKTIISTKLAQQGTHENSFSQQNVDQQHSKKEIMLLGVAYLFVIGLLILI